jgi:hypothetical protein
MEAAYTRDVADISLVSLYIHTAPTNIYTFTPQEGGSMYLRNVGSMARIHMV